MVVFRSLLRRLLLVLGSGGALVGCAKSSGPLKLYFISANRFTSGNRSVVVPGDTLATRLYATAATGNTLKRFQVTVAYSPSRVPFAYPSTVLGFNYSALPKDSLITYLDSTLTSAAGAPTEFLYTTVFGARTTSGTERWLFTATDKDGNTSSRTFTLSVRRSDSTAVYHDYQLNLPSTSYTPGARRFIELKSGIAYPAYSVVGSVPNPPCRVRLMSFCWPTASASPRPTRPPSS
ncbi:hypothetical protein [Hymenobacter sp. BRD67]|uniref:hypothetical protein n=1 Tax=Hymenobacter sp. BRD67 TaxID=2675877 RepID=UPI001566D566|nr:hypothetical protein [Hymenobacter sp. BRD67]QKG54392.1 hypothetical protein GKZ67_19540 [Hymenobacter sp. BRD67]